MNFLDRLFEYYNELCESLDFKVIKPFEFTGTGGKATFNFKDPIVGEEQKSKVDMWILPFGKEDRNSISEDVPAEFRFEYNPIYDLGFMVAGNLSRGSLGSERTGYMLYLRILKTVLVFAEQEIPIVYSKHKHQKPIIAIGSDNGSSQTDLSKHNIYKKVIDSELGPDYRIKEITSKSRLMTLVQKIN